MLTGTWLTEGTQVLTPTGWVGIETIVCGSKVLSRRDGKMEMQYVISTAKTATRSPIDYYTGDFTLYARNLQLPDKPTVLKTKEELDIKKRPVGYIGHLFQIETESNEIVVRDYTDYHHNNDYVICRVK